MEADGGVKRCIYPGCGHPAVPPPALGGPQPAFCELEEHNALTAHQERQRLAREAGAREGGAREARARDVAREAGASEAGARQKRSEPESRGG